MLIALVSRKLQLGYQLIPIEVKVDWRPLIINQSA